ncbi:MAG: hypothetical protein ACJAT1_002267 [Marivirga sp.]|jgi:hypothetical protein
MDHNDFSIVSSETKTLSKGTRIYNSIYGIIVITFCAIYYQARWLPLIGIGTISVIYGLVGKALLKTNNSIIITQSAILIKRSFQQNVSINLKDIKRIMLDLYELQVDFIDYTKIYDLSWLTRAEHHKLKEKLSVLIPSN